MPSRILVIDDNEDMLDLFRALLDDEGYEVIGSNFIDARAVEQLQPDLLILDYLWGMDPIGGRIASALKQHPTTTDLPVIICTTTAMTKLAEDPALNMEGVSIVQKPFDVPELLHTVEQLLNKRKRFDTGSKGNA